MTISIDLILELFGGIAVLAGGIAGITKLIKFITDNHDNKQKYDGYASVITKQRKEIDDKISELESKLDNTYSTNLDSIEQMQADTDAKIQEIRAEQCMMMSALLAILEGLIEQGCNGPVTDARDNLDKYLNIQAHK